MAAADKLAIVGFEDVDPAALFDHPENYRRHPLDQKVAMQAVMDTVGWASEILVNRRTGRILDGHLRAELARVNGEPTVPVRYVDCDEEREQLILTMLDPTAAMAGADRDKLVGLLGSLITLPPELAVLMSNLGRDAGIAGLAALTAAPGPVAAPVSPPAALPAASGTSESTPTGNDPVAETITGEPSGPPAEAIVDIVVGDISFLVTASEYAQWLTSLRGLVGKNPEAARKEILVRLGITT